MCGKIITFHCSKHMVHINKGQWGEDIGVSDRSDETHIGH